jgi:integrase
VVSLKPGPDGQRRRKKISGKNKTEVRARLAELHDELNDGVVTNAAYTVAQAIKDWLADGLAGRAPKTVSTQREVLEPLIDIIGAVPLRELSAATVRSALKDLAATRATRTVAMTHAGLTRAIRHAEANDKVRRNVATLVDTPVGQEGRPSKSLTFGQAVALIRAARSYGLYAYVVLSLLVGVRTEEARALRWDHVDFGTWADPIESSAVLHTSRHHRRPDTGQRDRLRMCHGRDGRADHARADHALAVTWIARSLFRAGAASADPAAWSGRATHSRCWRVERCAELGRLLAHFGRYLRLTFVNRRYTASSALQFLFG